MMQLMLVRHGKTEGNLRRLYYGSTDLPLCPEGEAELRCKSILLEGEWHFLTSGMLRTEQTLDILFGDVIHESDARFREMDFGRFEMKSYEDLKDREDYQRWICGDNEANVTPDGESGFLVRDRVMAGLQDLLLKPKNTVLVTHGGVIALIMAELFPEEEKNRYQWQPPCGGGYLLQRCGETWKYSPIPPNGHIG